LRDDGLINEIDSLIKRIMEGPKEDDKGGIDDNFDENFNEYLASSIAYGMKGDKKVPYFPCDTCKRKQIIDEQYKRICNKEYVPAYVDSDCRDFKIALVVDRIDEETLHKVFKYLTYRITIREIVDCIKDPEWRRQAESILRVQGFCNFIEATFGRFDKKTIMQVLFDLSYCYFDDYTSRNLAQNECIEMLKYYVVLLIRNKIKDSIFRIIKLIELELEYKIAVIESEIRYYIKCVLQEIAITPLPATNYNINYFNKVGSLTELLKIFNGSEGGRHDERSDFRHIRDTVRKYEKVVRTTLDALNKKIKQFECLIEQRRFIVGITGICERPNVIPVETGGTNVLIPPQPLVILSPPKTGSGGSGDGGGQQ
jgi:hypothetical protein